VPLDVGDARECQGVLNQGVVIPLHHFINKGSCLCFVYFCMLVLCERMCRVKAAMKILLMEVSGFWRICCRAVNIIFCSFFSYEAARCAC
jgi:hypothetical protein